MVKQGDRLWQKVTFENELTQLEQEGFERGVKKGKTMNVTLDVVVGSLAKQYRDWLKAWSRNDVYQMKRTLADLRNVAGCVFLKLKETSKNG